MSGRGLTPDAQQAEFGTSGLDRGPHRFHQPVSSMTMIDHRLARLSDGTQIRPFQGVVSDHVALGRFADDRVHSPFPIEQLDAIRHVEVGIGVGAAVRLVDPAGDFQSIAFSIVTDPVFAGLVRRGDVGVGVFRFFAVQSLPNVLQKLDRRVFSLHSKMELRALPTFLNPPQAVENGVRLDSIGDLSPGLMFELPAERDSVLENAEFEGVGIDRHADFEGYDGTIFVGHGPFDEFDAAEKSLEQIITPTSRESREVESSTGKIPDQWGEFREAGKIESELDSGGGIHVFVFRVFFTDPRADRRVLSPPAMFDDSHDFPLPWKGRSRWSCLVGLGLAIGQPLALGQAVDPGEPDAPVAGGFGEQALAPPPVRSIEEGPEIDGILEEIWEAGTLLPDTWRQVDPVEGGPPSQRTEVRLMRDRRNLYVAIRCFDDEVDGIIARALQRDGDIRSDDNIRLVLDPKRDLRTGYVFSMNPLGARSDSRLVNGRTDRNWDAVWEGRASIDDEGWTAEFVIPFRTLSIDPAARSWGINIERTIRRGNERIRLVAADRDINLESVADAAVVGMFGDIDQGSGIDVKPYGKMTWQEGEDSGADPAAGVDVFWKITPSLTFVGTVNPDFAETEVDQRIINFSRFSIRFPEKRDFFLEDAGYFNFGGIRSTPAPFYSRRIGLSPQGEPQGIMGGVKLTGSVGDVSVGLLDTVMTKGVSPADRNYFAGRALVNVFEQSSVGVIATAGNPLDGRSNQLVGADFNFVTSDLPGGKRFSANAWFQQTVTDDVAGIGATSAGFRLSYPNDDWRASFGWFVIGPEYFPALGFVNRVGVHELFGGVSRRWRPDIDWLRSVSVGVNGYWVPDLDFNTQSLDLEFDLAKIQFERGDSAFLEVGLRQEVPDDDFRVAGELLVPAGDYTWSEVGVGFETTSKEPVEIGVEGGWSGYYGGRRLEMGTDVRWQPAPSILLGGSLQWNDIALDTGNLETWLASGRVNFFFSPLVSWENLVQYDTQSGTVGLNSRLRWAFRDGEEIFVVFNQNVEADDLEFTLDTTEIVAKIGWTFSF